MRGAQRLGVAFLDRTAQDWSSSYFATHNWWHRALYHLELREVDEALALYDGPIRGTRSNEWLDVDDAASLLWRLHLFGVDVGDRARTLFEDVEGLLGEPVAVFNDWHAVMSAGLAGASEVCERLISVNRSARDGTNRRAIDAAGLQLLEGFAAFARGDNDRALRRLVDMHAEGPRRGRQPRAERRDRPDHSWPRQRGPATSPWRRRCSPRRVERKPSAMAAGLELIRTNSAVAPPG